jgi:hypothetical protein
MGEIIDTIKNKIIKTAQSNLLYIVSYYFTQEKYKNSNSIPFIMCQPKKENETQKINNFPLISFKFDYPHIKYTKYEYRQMNVLQIIMLTPKIFISLTDEGIQIWHESFGIQKISTQFFDKLKSINKSEIKNTQLTKFDDDLFFLTFEIIPINNNNNISSNKINELKGLQFVLFSAKKIINEGKITELFSINKIKTAFPISKTTIFISIKSEIKIIDIYEKKVIKTDKNLELFNFNISFAKHLFEDIILISSINENKSIIYSLDKLQILYFISDKILTAFTLGNNKVVLIGEKIKEILLLPDMYVLSLSQYETDIFNSIETKTFYSINENTFLFINHKNKKLKEVSINENNELIITKDILCPTEFITFCPFVYTYENVTQLLCSLFICRDQTYKITNHELNNLIINEDSDLIYSSIKRLFLNFFELDKNNEGEIGSTNSTNPSFVKQFNDFDNIYIPYSIIPPDGASTLNFAIYKNKKLYELNSFYNYFDPNIKIEIFLNNYSKDIYILSIIKNIHIYILKINGFESWDICHNYKFGNIKSKGIIKLKNDNAFIYYDKKAIIINIIESFKSKINPIDTFIFPFNILYAYYYISNIILISDSKIYLFDYYNKKIQKEMDLGFKIINNEDETIENIDINILQIQDDIYILIIGLDYLLFNINTFEKIINPTKYNINKTHMLFFNSSNEYFEIIKKDIITNKVIEMFKEKTDLQKHKMKYLSNNRIFVGTYPNKFFIFENNENFI